MNYSSNRWTRGALVIVLLLGGIFSLVSPARAQGIQVTFEDSVPAGTVVENDAVLAGTTVKLDGDVDGDALAVGSTVEVNGDVEGSLVAVGQNVVINGTVGGTTYVVALTLELGPEAELNRNLYNISGSTNLAEGSMIGRDLVLVSLGAQLSGEIGRNTEGIIGPFEIFRLFMDMIGRPVLEPQSGLESSGLSDTAQVAPIQYSGILPSVSSIALTGPAEKVLSQNQASPPTKIEPRQSTQTGSTIDSERVADWAQRVVLEFITLLVFGLLGIWLFSSFLNRSAQKVESKPLQATGYGLLGLILSIALIGVLILVALLILMLGIGLGYLNLWDLAWAVWGVGFASLGLAFWVSLLFVSFGTKVIVAYLIGLLILRRLAPKANQYLILPLLLGLFLYVLLASIPYFGWVIAVLVNSIGLGAAWLAYREKGQNSTEEIEELEQPDNGEES
jgi:cytoskeletal protein CcmA (bactofilin family)